MATVCATHCAKVSLELTSAIIQIQPKPSKLMTPEFQAMRVVDHGTKGKHASIICHALTSLSHQVYFLAYSLRTQAKLHNWPLHAGCWKSDSLFLQQKSDNLKNIMHAYIHLCLQRNHINQALSGTLTDWVQI
jgi:hypothetical protein